MKTILLPAMLALLIPAATADAAPARNTSVRAAKPQPATAVKLPPKTAAQAATPSNAAPAPSTEGGTAQPGGTPIPTDASATPASGAASSDAATDASQAYDQFEKAIEAEFARLKKSLKDQAVLAEIEELAAEIEATESYLSGFALQTPMQAVAAEAKRIALRTRQAELLRRLAAKQAAA